MSFSDSLKSFLCSKTDITEFKKVSHVIFNLDGLLLDTESIHTEVLQNLLNQLGKTFTIQLQQKIAGCFETEAAHILKDELNLDIEITELVNIFNTNVEQKIMNAKLMPGAERIVRHFHKNQVPIAVTTTSTESHYELKISYHHELFDLFHHIVCGSDPEVKVGKPSPDIFLICASRFPNKPKSRDCLVFEDSRNGLKGAVKAGMQVVMVPGKDVPEDIWCEATLKVDSLLDVKPELFGLPAF